MMILGVRLDETTPMTALEQAKNFLTDGKQHTIFTPNPEMLVDAYHDPLFRDVLNRGSLNLCDGKGIELIAHGQLRRMPGIDFMLELMRLTEETGRGVYLLGSGSQKVITKTKTAILRQFPKLKLVGTHIGPKIETVARKDTTTYKIEYSKEENDLVLDQIIDLAPDILFVAFGHGKQEKWLQENLSHLPSVRIAMGVGGAFDIISGKISRAPRLLRRFGLEWLWRLIMQPWRIKRIWKATVVFPYLFYKDNWSKVT